MFIRPAVPADLPEIGEIYAYAREFMRKTGNPNQWKNDRPAMSTVEADIRQGNFYVAAENDTLVGCFAFIQGNDPTYLVIEDGQWLSDAPYGTIHRIAGNGKARGVMQAAIEYCRKINPNIRIDTHEDNKVMQHLILKNGFAYCGIIYTDDGTRRLAYQTRT